MSTVITLRWDILPRCSFYFAVSAFKILSIDDGTFIEDIDLRGGTDTVNLNYSFTDVTWNLKEGNFFAE